MQGNLKDAILYASKNPTSQFSQQLADMIKSGQLDDQAKSLGLDLTPIKSSSLGTQKPAQPATLEATPGNPHGLPSIGKKIAPIADKLATGEMNTAKALFERGTKVFDESIKTGQRIANEPTTIGKLAEVGALGGKFAGQVAGGVGDIFIEMISPFIPQEIKDVYKEETSKALDDIKTFWNTPSVNPKEEEVKQKINGFFKGIIGKANENPEVASAVGDLVNVLLLGGGGAAERAGISAVKSGAETVLDSAGNVVKKGLTKADEALSKTTGAVEKMQATRVAQKSAEQANQVFKDSLAISRPNAQLVEKAGIAEKRIIPGTQGYLKGAEVAPSAIETRIAEAVQPLVESGEITVKMMEKDPALVQKVIDQRVSQINNGLGNMAADHNIVFTKNFNPKTYLDSAKEGSKLVFAGDKALERAYDSAVTRFNQLIKTKDLEGVIKARKAFDAEMKSKYPNLFKPDIFGNMSPRDSAIKNAIFDVRDSANQFISDALPANNPYKALLKQESYLLRASENIGTKMKGISQDKKFFDTKTGKVIKYGGGLAIPGGAGALGVKLIE